MVCKVDILLTGEYHTGTDFAEEMAEELCPTCCHSFVRVQLPS